MGMNLCLDVFMVLNIKCKYDADNKVNSFIWKNFHRIRSWNQQLAIKYISIVRLSKFDIRTQLNFKLIIPFLILNKHLWLFTKIFVHLNFVPSLHSPFNFAFSYLLLLTLLSDWSFFSYLFSLLWLIVQWYQITKIIIIIKCNSQTLLHTISSAQIQSFHFCCEGVKKIIKNYLHRYYFLDQINLLHGTLPPY